MSSTRTSTTHRIAPDAFVVGWAADVVQIWPEEDRRIQRPARHRVSQALGSPEAVLELLAAVDGTDETAYRRRYAAEAGAVLALTHHSETEVLRASVEVRGPLSPSTLLAQLDVDALRHRLAS